MLRMISFSALAVAFCSLQSGCCGCCRFPAAIFNAAKPPPPVVFNQPPPIVIDKNPLAKDNFFKDLNPPKDQAIGPKDFPFPKDNPFKDAGVPALGKQYVYNQTTGRLTLDDQLIGAGYSGKAPQGKNNPQLQNVLNVGPIPRGEYAMFKQNDPKTGEPTFNLLPSGHNAAGRFPGQSFAIQSDAAAPGNGSNGSIIMPREVREKLANSTVSKLVVQ